MVDTFLSISVQDPRTCSKTEKGNMNASGYDQFSTIINQVYSVRYGKLKDK
jgi:hypothetical protein